MNLTAHQHRFTQMDFDKTFLLGIAKVFSVSLLKLICVHLCASAVRLLLLFSFRVNSRFLFVSIRG
jgi:hypothetical protein